MFDSLLMNDNATAVCKIIIGFLILDFSRRFRAILSWLLGFGGAQQQLTLIAADGNTTAEGTRPSSFLSLCISISSVSTYYSSRFYMSSPGFWL